MVGGVLADLVLRVEDGPVGTAVEDAEVEVRVRLREILEGLVGEVDLEVALDRLRDVPDLDLDLRERVAIVLLILPIVWIGIYPDPLLRRIEPSVSVLLQQMQLSEMRSHAQTLAVAPPAEDAE